MLAEQEGFLRTPVQQIIQQVLEAEMEEAMGAEKGERTPNRLGFRSGYYQRTPMTRVSKLERRIPQDRQGRFRTEVFERYHLSEKALVGALAEMYGQGVSTPKVKGITEESCGQSSRHLPSATSIRISFRSWRSLLIASCRRNTRMWSWMRVTRRSAKTV